MDDGWWIVFGVLAFVLLLNAGLVLTALRYRKSSPRPIFGESIRDLLNPWKDEDQALDELHEEVDKLKRRDHD
jgi:hypothetical protein